MTNLVSSLSSFASAAKRALESSKRRRIQRFMSQLQLMPEEAEEVADTVKKLLHMEIIGDVSNGDLQQALEGLAALARLRGEAPDPLVLPEKVDLDDYLSRLRARYEEPEELHTVTTLLSPSHLRTYEDCPTKYRFQYVLGICPVAKTFFELGTVVHRVIEIISKRMIDGEDVTEEEALELLEGAWRPSVWDSREMERQDREAAEKMIRDFLVRQTAKDTRMVGVEEWFDLDLEGRRVSGKIDRVDDPGDHLEVIDYKTSKIKDSQPKLKQDFQMVLYWEGAEGIHGKPVGRVGHWYLRHDEETMVEITPDEREEVLQRVSEVIRAVEAGRFDAKPECRNCMYCDYADLCDDKYQ